jgi:hypothetical protein
VVIHQGRAFVLEGLPVEKTAAEKRRSRKGKRLAEKTEDDLIMELCKKNEVFQ